MLCFFFFYIGSSGICGQTSFLIKGTSAKFFDWKGYGLRLHIPQNALPAGQTKCSVHIEASLVTAKQLDLPDELEVVSAIYNISTSMSMEFTHPVTIEIQHCVRKDHDHAALSFIVSKSDSSRTFQTLKGGQFPTNHSYGCISVTHFSEYMIVLLWRWLRRRLLNATTDTAVGPATHPTTEPRSYRAQLFYIHDKRWMWKIDFVIICDLEVCLTVSFARILVWNCMH